MPYVSVKGIGPDRLRFSGIEKVAEDEEFDLYEDREGRISVAQRDNPYVWVEDVTDAIQMGSPSIIIRQGDT